MPAVAEDDPEPGGREEAKRLRFPGVRDLFEKVVDLKVRLRPMGEAIRFLAERLQGQAPPHFEYTAPPPDYDYRDLGLGNARDEGRCWVDTEDLSDEEEQDVIGRFEGSLDAWVERRLLLDGNRFDSWAEDFDRFHVEWRKWRRAIDAARVAIDEAAPHLDGRAWRYRCIDELLSVKIRQAVDRLAGAIPYDPEMQDHEDYPIAQEAWVDDMVRSWRRVGRFLSLLRSVRHMDLPRRAGNGGATVERPSELPLGTALETVPAPADAPHPRQIAPLYLRALASYEWVCQTHPHLVKDSLRQKFSEEMWRVVTDTPAPSYVDVNNQSIRVPPFESWKRYIRKARGDPGAPGASPRAGRPHGPSIAPRDRL